MDGVLRASRRAIVAGALGCLADARLSRAQASPLLTFAYGRHFDSAEQKALEAWSGVLARLADGWWRTITTRLASPGFTPVDQITIDFDDIHIPGAPALTRGSVIEVDARGLLARLRDPDALAMISHEMVHVAQRYPHAPGWLVEGIADYMRYYVLIPDDPGRAFQARGATWHDGYQASAGFLDWAEQGRPGTVTRLNAALRAGEDGEALLRETVGQPLPQAWTAYIESKPYAISPEAWRRRAVAQRLR
jgi:hypothetical protein